MRFGIKKLLMICAAVMATAITAPDVRAQSNLTDPAMCKQYAGFLRSMVNKAIQQNGSCLDWDRGVHDVYQMHYNWCLENPRDSVVGAADHIRNLVIDCTGQAQPVSPLQMSAPAPVYPTPQARWIGDGQYCEAEIRVPYRQEYHSQLLRLTAGSNGFWLITDYYNAGSVADVIVDGRRFTQRWERESDVVQTQIGMDLVQALKQGNSVGIAFDQYMDFPLSGSSAAIDTMLQCAGMRPEPQVSAGQGRVIYGSCKLIVDGVQYINIPSNCPIFMASDGRFQINSDQRGYLGDYFAEISPWGDGTASGHWNGSPGSTHAQALLGEDFRMGSGGCWHNGRATICAAR